MGPYPLEEVEKALALVQSLDPPGIAARTLTECLRLQLKHLGLEGSPADVMVRDYMKQLQSHQWPEIGRQMSLTPEEVNHHWEVIQGLDPRPGNRYSLRHGGSRAAGPAAGEAHSGGVRATTAARPLVRRPAHEPARQYTALQLPDGAARARAGPTLPGVHAAEVQ